MRRLEVDTEFWWRIAFENIQLANKSKAIPLHAMVALGGRGGIAPTHS
jgi:hypothetical protein